MKINTSPNEKSVHISLKKKAIELLSNRKDVIDINTEYRVKTERGLYYSYVDVFATKENGGCIYVEVKSDGNLSEAIRQLKVLDKNNPNDEFIAIANIRSAQYFKSIWRKKLLAWQKFINKTQIYTFNEDSELKYIDIHYKEGKELWVNGLRII